MIALKFYAHIAITAAQSVSCPVRWTCRLACRLHAFHAFISRRIDIDTSRLSQKTSYGLVFRVMTSSTTQISGIAELYTAMNYDETKDVFPAAKKWLSEKDALKCFYNGKLELISGSSTYKTQAVNDPCNDEYLISVVVPSSEDVKNVIQSFLVGQKSWSNLDQHSRGKFISSLAKKFEEQRNVLAEVEALTTGTALSEAKQEISRASTYFHYYAAWAHAISKKIEDTEKGIVVALSKPAPVLALATIVAPALAAGRAVILNPSFEASLTSFLFAELCSDAGLPPGVVNVVSGSLETAQEIIEKHVEKAVIWGSKCKSENVATFAKGIPCSNIPFYYGKSVSIIFDSCDQSSAIEVLLRNMSFNFQQMPWCVRTILVEESAFPTFVAKLKNKLNSQKVGSSRDQGIDIGLPKQCDPNTSSFLKGAINYFSQRGIEVFQLPVADSLFFPPTLIIGTDAEMNSIVKDNEVLPFVAVVPFRNSKEALEFANKSHFGVAASIWTSCLSLAMFMATNLEVGTVWINDHGLLDPSVPFSSRKEGFGCFGSAKGLQQFLSFDGNYSNSLDLKKGKETATSQVQKEYFAHYGGAFKQTSGEARYTVLSSSGCHFLVHGCDKSDVKKAVETARVAQQKWWKLGSNARTAILLSAADKFQETSKDLLKFFKSPLPESEKELENSVKNFYYWASRCNSMMSFRNDNPINNYMVQNLQDPIGVIGILEEDSSELEGFVLAVLSAICFGNSVVVILNCRNPVLALEFCAFLSNLKVPPGLVNALPGSKCTLYSELVFHKDIQRLWYSGSDNVSLNTLHKKANQVTKCLWKFPSNSATWDASDFEYAASYPKAVWLPSENASC